MVKLTIPFFARGKKIAFIKYFRKYVKEITKEVKSAYGNTNLYDEARKGMLTCKKHNKPLVNEEDFKKYCSHYEAFKGLFPKVKADFNYYRALFAVYNSKSEEELFNKFKEFYKKNKKIAGHLRVALEKGETAAGDVTSIAAVGALIQAATIGLEALPAWGIVLLISRLNKKVFLELRSKLLSIMDAVDRER